MNVVTAGMPSAPCRFSTTTGCPQRSVSRSAMSRAERSMPLPGGSGTINRTVFCGQAWVCASAGVVAIATTRTTMDANRFMHLFPGIEGQRSKRTETLATGSSA